MYAHDEESGRKLASRFASTAKGASLPIQRAFFNESILDFAELGSGRALPGVCEDRIRNSLYTASSPSFFDVAAMKELYRSYSVFVNANPVANRSILLFEAGSMQGISAFPGDHSAYAHRGKMSTNAIIQMSWDNDELTEAANSWARSTRDILNTPEVSGYERPYGYINYANHDEPLSVLYGYDDWRHERLTNLKNRYDPYGHFNAYRPIPHDVANWDQASEVKKRPQELVRDEL